MIELILFVIAVLAWDKFKKSARSPRKPTVSIRHNWHAECGCVVDHGMNEVKAPCAAHSIMLDLRDFH